jgi:hypothetical protein
MKIENPMENQVDPATLMTVPLIFSAYRTIISESMNDPPRTNDKRLIFL